MTSGGRCPQCCQAMMTTPSRTCRRDVTLPGPERGGGRGGFVVGRSVRCGCQAPPGRPHVVVRQRGLLYCLPAAPPWGEAFAVAGLRDATVGVGRGLLHSGWNARMTTSGWGSRRGFFFFMGNLKLRLVPQPSGWIFLKMFCVQTNRPSSFAVERGGLSTRFGSKHECHPFEIGEFREGTLGSHILLYDDISH